MQVTEQDVKTHSPMIRRMANRLAYRRKREDLADDLFQEGMVGMLQAFRTFDPDGAAQISTHIYTHAIGRMYRFVSRNISVVRQCGGDKKRRAVWSGGVEILTDLSIEDCTQRMEDDIKGSEALLPDEQMEQDELVAGVKAAVLAQREQEDEINRLIIDKRIYTDDPPLTIPELARMAGRFHQSIAKRERAIRARLRERFTEMIATMETQNRCDEYAITAVVNSLAPVAPGAAGVQVATKLSGCSFCP